MPDVRSALSAAAVADLVPLCSRCLESEGLCVGCGRTILPQISHPSWVKLMGKVRPKAEVQPELSREGAKIARRKARKASRLARAVAGEFTRVRRVA